MSNKGVKKNKVVILGLQPYLSFDALTSRLGQLSDMLCKTRL